MITVKDINRLAVELQNTNPEEWIKTREVDINVLMVLVAMQWEIFRKRSMDADSLYNAFRDTACNAFMVGFEAGKEYA